MKAVLVPGAVFFVLIIPGNPAPNANLGNEIFPMSSNELFYSRMPVNTIPLSDLLQEEHLFYKVPPDWHVIITDVKKSTDAVINGLHETVNLVATGSIVAVLNIAFKQDLALPFFFGGDGATFIIPGLMLEQVLKALVIHSQNTAANFMLELRVGHVPVERIYAEGHELKISKLKTNDLFSIPVAVGNGLAFAEKIIKGEDYRLGITEKITEEVDLSGMECRWDKIKPPVNYDEVVSLLVLARPGVKQETAFKKVIDEIDRIYGSQEKRKPITIPRLKLKATLKKIAHESKVKLGRYRPLYAFQHWLTTLLGTLYFRTKPGKTYLAQLVDLSDTLVIDGKINTVISGTSKQRAELEEKLKQFENEGLIHYGIFVSKESVMSCYVRSRDAHHIHFIDGSDGGYTRAAGMLKQKLRISSPQV